MSVVSVRLTSVDIDVDMHLCSLEVLEEFDKRIARSADKKFEQQVVLSVAWVLGGNVLRVSGRDHLKLNQQRPPQTQRATTSSVAGYRPGTVLDDDDDDDDDDGGGGGGGSGV